MERKKDKIDAIRGMSAQNFGILFFSRLCKNREGADTLLVEKHCHESTKRAVQCLIDMAEYYSTLSEKQASDSFYFDKALSHAAKLHPMYPPEMWQCVFSVLAFCDIFPRIISTLARVDKNSIAWQNVKHRLNFHDNEYVEDSRQV